MFCLQHIIVTWLWCGDTELWTWNCSCSPASNCVMFCIQYNAFVIPRTWFYWVMWYCRTDCSLMGMITLWLLLCYIMFLNLLIPGRGDSSRKKCWYHKKSKKCCPMVKSVTWSWHQRHSIRAGTYNPRYSIALDRYMFYVVKSVYFMSKLSFFFSFFFHVMQIMCL